MPAPDSTRRGPRPSTRHSPRRPISRRGATRRAVQGVRVPLSRDRRVAMLAPAPVGLPFRVAFALGVERHGHEGALRPRWRDAIPRRSPRRAGFVEGVAHLRTGAERRRVRRVQQVAPGACLRRPGGVAPERIVPVAARTLHPAPHRSTGHPVDVWAAPLGPSTEPEPRGSR